MCLTELALQNIVDDGAKVLGCGYGLGKFWPHIEILQIETSDNFPLHTFVQINQIADHARTLIHLPAEGDFERVVMPVSMRIIALAVGHAIFFAGHRIAVQAVRGGEAITTTQMGLHMQSPPIPVIPTKLLDWLRQSKGAWNLSCSVILRRRNPQTDHGSHRRVRDAAWRWSTWAQAAAR